MNKEQLSHYINDHWDQRILPVLREYIRIPNKSPAYDAEWEKNGYMEKAITLVSQWCQQQQLKNASLQIHREPGRTPLLTIEVKGNSEKTILLYGHLDKQPELTGWQPDLGPWQPVIKNDRLYGRGGADDGYAVFAAVTAIAALQQQNIPHAHCIILIECCEESGSTDLSFYIEKLKTQLSATDLVICLDSGCINYDQLWCTIALRGIILANLTVKILNQGVHSGAAGGIVPSSFRILRQLLNRIEDEKTGKILLPELQVTIPPECITAAQQLAKIAGNKIWQDLPFATEAEPVTTDIPELILNNTWRSTMEIVGSHGIPDIASAGNTLRPETTVKLAIRLPPTCDPSLAATALKNTLEKDPPYHANVTVTILDKAIGWYARPMSPWLADAVQQAAKNYFNADLGYFGEGGTIPFMGMLSAQFPQAQFVVTGVLGPESNAHGPNEFLHIPTAKKITCCIAEILQKHAEAATENK